MTSYFEDEAFLSGPCGHVINEVTFLLTGLTAPGLTALGTLPNVHIPGPVEWNPFAEWESLLFITWGSM